ncbi:hypothetical protein [Paenibacillus sp. NPDC057967]|uniref:hypothetical protein n=1 Tax=Paenibacillus sp. NPDC057967 TaxID=3346293 RepID=UPI0036D79B4B
MHRFRAGIGSLGIIVLICCIGGFFLSRPAAATRSDLDGCCATVEKLERRLDKLEPKKPMTIPESEERLEAAKLYPEHTLPTNEVRAAGTQIPFRTIKEDPSYKRPIYHEHWHSTYWGGRWSNIASHVDTALHRLFATYDIGLSGEMTFKEQVGVDFPMFQNPTDLDLYLVVFQTAVIDVYTKGNQIVVIGRPQRLGVQVITIKTSDLRPVEPDKLLLVQLATPEGDELDYTLISYEPPDFWQKQEKRSKAGTGG